MFAVGKEEVVLHSSENEVFTHVVVAAPFVMEVLGGGFVGRLWVVEDVVDAFVGEYKEDFKFPNVVVFAGVAEPLGCEQF